jgi:hypothetical protein
MWADRGKSLLFIVAAACNAFLWFYLDEARPYIMQYGVSCGTGYLLISFQRSKRVPLRNYWLFSLALIVLAGASMLGAAWSATAILVMSVILLRKRTRPPLLPLIVCAGALGILGSYYLWTLTNGVFGSRLPTQLILNIFYVPYELCGFAGLGPGRLDIREAGLSSFRPFAWPLAAFAITWLMLIFYLLRAAAWKDEKSSTLIIFGFAIPPVLCLFLVGLFINFNILGRHVTPAMPFVLLVVTLGITLLLQKKRALPGVVAVVFALLSISSCFGIRFCPWHSKDNYRGAAAAVSELVQDRQVAWWCASWEAAEYYHLPVRQKPDERSASILVVRSPNAEQLRSLPAPDVVVLSKPDIYDSKGTIAAMLQQENFSQIQTFKAFAIWKRP